MSLQLPSLSKQSQQSDFVLFCSPPSLIICLSLSLPPCLALRSHTYTHLQSRARDQGQLRWSRARSPHTSIMGDCLLVSPISWDHITSNKLAEFQIFCLSLLLLSFPYLFFHLLLFLLQQQINVSEGRRPLLMLLAIK